MLRDFPLGEVILKCGSRLTTCALRLRLAMTDLCYAPCAMLYADCRLWLKESTPERLKGEDDLGFNIKEK